MTREETLAYQRGYNAGLHSQDKTMQWLIRERQALKEEVERLGGNWEKVLAAVHDA